MNTAPCQAVYFPGNNTLNLINDDGSALVARLELRLEHQERSPIAGALLIQGRRRTEGSDRCDCHDSFDPEAVDVWRSENGLCECVR